LVGEEKLEGRGATLETAAALGRRTCGVGEPVWGLPDKYR